MAEASSRETALRVFEYTGGILLAANGTLNIANNDSTNPEHNHYISTEIASRDFQISLEQVGSIGMIMSGVGLIVAASASLARRRIQK